MFRIAEKKPLNEAVTLYRIEAPLVAEKALPGQFLILIVDEFGERIPLTIADHDAATVTVIVQQVGRSTKLLSGLDKGDSVFAVVGPLGVPTELDGIKNCCVIGGGVGCAIAYPQAKALFNSGANVDVIAGFRGRELVILEEELRNVSRRLLITTDNGSYGEKGFVTDRLRGEIEAGEKYDAVIAIGPIPMMRAVSELTREYSVRTIVSLNPVMIDGTGMCGCCRVTVAGETKFACVDGPDFDGHLVDFDELSRRNRIYSEQERHDDAHTCRLDGRIVRG